MRKNPYAMCKLDNGRIVPYSVAADIGGGQSYHADAFQYIGEGVIWAIGGKVQPFSERLQFYVLRPNRPRRMR